MGKEYKQFLSVGIDIGADFSLMAVALPSQELLGKPYRILHSSQHSLDGAIERIRIGQSSINCLSAYSWNPPGFITSPCITS